MSVAFVTMVYNDHFFLELWLNHYKKFTPLEDIHIVMHGPQPYVHEMAAGCTIVECERDPRNPRLDQDRLAFMSDYCSSLTEKYDRVIFNDVDEVIVLDPNAGSNLVDYISSIPDEHKVVTPLGLEIIHRSDVESDYDYSRPMFGQRQYVRMNGWYTKPNIISVPVIWGPDGHGSSHDEIYLDENLFTFHLKWFDQSYHLKRHEERLGFRFKDENGDEVIIGAGSWSWSAQMYRLVTNGFLRFNMHGIDEDFKFERQRSRVRESFTAGAPGLYKINWFAEGDLYALPERFIGMI